MLELKSSSLSTQSPSTFLFLKKTKVNSCYIREYKTENNVNNKLQQDGCSTTRLNRCLFAGKQDWLKDEGRNSLQGLWLKRGMWNGRAFDRCPKQLCSLKGYRSKQLPALAPGSGSGLGACLQYKGKHQVLSPHLTGYFLFDQGTDGPPAKRKGILQTLLTVVLLIRRCISRLFLLCFCHSCVDTRMYMLSCTSSG